MWQVMQGQEKKVRQVSKDMAVKVGWYEIAQKARVTPLFHGDLSYRSLSYRNLCCRKWYPRNLKVLESRGLQWGFTFVEMAVTLVVLAIAAGFAIPAYQQMTIESAIRGTTSDLVAALNTARAESRSLRVCATVAGTDEGWSLTYPDATSTDAVAAKCPAVPAGMTVTKHTWQQSSNRQRLDVKDSGGNEVEGFTFQPNGFIYEAGAPFILKVCDPRYVEGQKITLQKSGQLETTDVDCTSVNST
jgi:type IV fimbrial biogenesis protein FimT